MLTSTSSVPQDVRATAVHFVDDTLYVSLADGRELEVPMEQFGWLDWLRKATPEQRARWSLEPRGFAVYWEELDDGIEVRHLLEETASVTARETVEWGAMRPVLNTSQV